MTRRCHPLPVPLQAGTGAEWVDWAGRTRQQRQNDYTYTVTGLNNGAEYTFQVRAYILSPPQTVTPAVDAPGGAGDEADGHPRSAGGANA